MKIIDLWPDDPGATRLQRLVLGSLLAISASANLLLAVVVPWQFVLTYESLARQRSLQVRVQELEGQVRDMHATAQRQGLGQ